MSGRLLPHPELRRLEAERDEWRRRAESALRHAPPSQTRSPRSRRVRLRAVPVLLAASAALAAVLGGSTLVERPGGARPDYPACIGRARYENPIVDNQYQELVNALYACRVYQAG